MRVEIWVDYGLSLEFRNNKNVLGNLGLRVYSGSGWFRIYSRSPKVGNPIASILKSNV